jgi:tRNA A-37 threonylcarbamoyl transferase component Bud32
MHESNLMKGFDEVLQFLCPFVSAFCSESGHAPHILAYEELPGGWKAIAMEFIETGILITMVPELTTCRDKWTEELKKLIKSFHEIGFMHKDLCNPNIICDDKGGVFLVDFDWSGKDEESIESLRL